MAQDIIMPGIYSVACHTDNVGVGTTFVAIKGMKDDGIHHIKTALEKGATTIVVEHSAHIPDEIKQLIKDKKATLDYVLNARAALAQLSAQAAEYPARKLKIVGVTGTKGKTTSSFLLEHVLKSAGLKTALLSTVHNKMLDTIVPTNLTTQHPDYLHNFFAVCVQHNIDIVIMEVAAQATSLHRVDGLEFDGLIFTNFAQEHGEFYATMDDYFAAKVAIAQQVKPNAPLLLNADDVRVADLSKDHENALLFGIQNVSVNYRATIVDNGLSALKLQVTADESHDLTIDCSSLLGEYNAYNILGVASLCLELGIDSKIIAQAINTFERVPGRLERYQLPNGANCFIDYAHNPSSYQAVLSVARSMTPHLIVVFGCGGERDASKRPLMGAIASEFADLVVLTSDNPRSENAADIVADILTGIAEDKRAQVICELDREAAIKTAYGHSQAGSVIMLLGKGPDEYQLIGKQKLPFSEKAIVQSLP
jgi:UDP-N-acetylmuramyl-tripeptide synthetase